MATPLRVLIVEDDEDDAQLLVAELRRGGYAPHHLRVDTDEALAAALAEEGWQAVFADHAMPHYNALAALRRVQASGRDLPFIIVSGVLDEAAAVDALKAGAHDFMVKGNLHRLLPALQRELRETELRSQRREAAEALRLAQQKYRQWVEHLPAITFEADEAGVTYISPQVESLLGFTPQEWMAVPDFWEQRLHPGDRERVQQDYARARRLGLPFQAEYRLLARDGREVWVLDETRQLPGPAGRRPVLGVYVDITARKQAELVLRQREAELRLMTDQLLQAARLATMGELAASIAHQLNNPLAIVSLRVEQLAGRAAPGSTEAEWLAAVEAACDRMRSLVANLLHYSQRSVRQISTLDLCQEVGRTIEFVQYPLSLRNITCGLECAEGVPAIRGDRQNLRQVFLNLFNNAGEAMPQGGVLAVRVSPVEHGGVPAAVVEVRDTGRGIAPEVLPRVWDTFYTTRADGHGTGLGLPICRRIVEEHGGAIAITSELGQGTTVRVVLPVVEGLAVNGLAAQ